MTIKPDTPLKVAELIVTPVSPLAIGLVCCPQVARFVREIDPIPILIDPRLMVDTSEMFYDRKTWDARCKEQRDWENHA